MSSERLDHDSSPQPDEASLAAPAAVGVTAPSHPGTQDFHIVGIGASAGGLDSLERLFTHLPTDTGMAFVVLQHLSPDFKSLMDELLSRRTQMPIRQAEPRHGARTEHRVSPSADEGNDHPAAAPAAERSGSAAWLDAPHRSVLPVARAGRRASAPSRSSCPAAAATARAVCRKSARPAARCSAKAPTPRNSTACRSARCAPARSTRCCRPRRSRWRLPRSAGRPPTSPPGRASDEERGVDAILRLLRDEYAIDFSHYKAGTVTRRIERRLALNRSLDIDMYVEQLRSDPRELSSLYEDLLIGVTRFFRDDAAFDTLEHRIIPELVERTDADEQIRVWVPGCATGQEAYSIAMLLHERLSARRRPVKRQDPRDRRAQDVVRGREHGFLQRGTGGRHRRGAAPAVLHAEVRTGIRSHRPSAKASSSRRTT